MDYLKKKKNKTLLYILPQLNFYSRNISNRIKTDNFYGCYIGYKALDTEHIYLLYKVIDEDTKSFVQWLSNKDYCVDYIDVDSVYKLLKIELPEKFRGSLERFIGGEYSEMYSKEDVDKIFMPIEYKYLKELQELFNKENEDLKKILTKNKEYEKVFLDKINNTFDTNLEKLNEKSEYDFKPNLKDEIFYYEPS